MYISHKFQTSLPSFFPSPPKQWKALKIAHLRESSRQTSVRERGREIFRSEKPWKWKEWEREKKDEGQRRLLRGRKIVEAFKRKPPSDKVFHAERIFPYRTHQPCVRFIWGSVECSSGAIVVLFKCLEYLAQTSLTWAAIKESSSKKKSTVYTCRFNVTRRKMTWHFL